MSDWKAEAEARRAAIVATLESLKLTVESRFVPFSQSRNKAEKHATLNWVVTVKRDGRDVLSTDYSAGAAHCPSYKQGNSVAIMLAHHECETGRKAKVDMTGKAYSPNGATIRPDAVDVIYSLSMDSSVLDYAGFEDWASEYGYDADSRSAESAYRACLDIALKLRAAIGEAGLETLKTVYQDF